jgi:hypothetical protein
MKGVGELTTYLLSKPGRWEIPADILPASTERFSHSGVPMVVEGSLLGLVYPGDGEVVMMNFLRNWWQFASALASVVFLIFIPAASASLLNVSDPSFDDNGPGNYAYPTSSSFKPGAFDIQQFQVFDDGTTIYFLLTLRDLTPTFGNALGAQLIDVYLHDPNAAAANTSTSAAFLGRNYQIAAAEAWSRLVEVQGFGQRYVDANGNTLGTVAISVSAATNTVMFSVPAATLGHPGPGWDAVVVLTGQDGFSPDLARGFTSTPTAFTFGVCATASADPHCTANPASVPRILDTITPTGTAQSNELDYTLHSPVVLFGAPFLEGGTMGAPPGIVPEPSTLALLLLGLLGFCVARLHKQSPLGEPEQPQRKATLAGAASHYRDGERRRQCG